MAHYNRAYYRGRRAEILAHMRLVKRAKVSKQTD